MTLATKWKFCSIYFLFFICEYTHKVWYKNLWNWHGNRNLMISDLWPHPKVTSLSVGWNFYLHSVLLVIYVYLICHMTMFEIFFWPPGHPLHPMTQVIEWKSRLIRFVSFICENTHKVWYKNLWNWLCNWNKMIFYLLTSPQGPRGQGPKNNFAVSHPIHGSNPHTKFGWILSNGLGGDSKTDRQQDGIGFWPLSTPKAHP